MFDDEFEWDDGKAAANEAKHGVTFAMACDVFADMFAISWVDDRRDYGESRELLVGMVEGRLLSVTYTMRGERIRLISARIAGVVERRRYFDAQFPA